MLPRYVKSGTQVVWKLPYSPHAANTGRHLTIGSAHSNYGVPQGSILRPAMLSLHMYDLPNAVQLSSVESYVDDTKIFLSLSSKDVDLSLERNSEDLRHAAK